MVVDGFVFVAEDDAEIEGEEEIEHEPGAVTVLI